jgi:hypothetical protein
MDIINYIVVILICFALGKLLASLNIPVVKKIIRIKKYDTINDRFVNNFYGNMLSTSGFIIVCVKLYGVTSMIFFGVTAMAVVVGYVMHVRDATGESWDDCIQSIITSDKTSDKLVFQTSILSLITAILITGFVGTKFVYPVVFKNTQTQTEESSEIEVEREDKEAELDKIIDDYIK